MAEKKRGRPRLDPQDASVNLHLRVPAKQFDATYAKATAARMSMAEWIRQQLGARPKA